MKKLEKAIIFTIISCMLSASAATSSWFQENGNSTTFHVFVQNIARGPSATAFTVATASVTHESPTMFGLVTVADDKLTEGPELDSAEVGRVQGLDAFADMKVPATLEVPNFLFTAGKFNGSTISFLGRHETAGGELPVVGGTGVFRFARGYAVMTTTYPDGYAADRAVLEYWIHVITF